MSELVAARNGWMNPDDPGEPGTGRPRWSVNDTEARLLGELFKGLNVLEIGTGLGISTREIAKLAKHVFTVDVDPWVSDNVANSLPSNVCFFSDIRFVPTELDAAFIDGLHTAEACTKDIEDARKIVKFGGLIVFHDALMNAVMKAIKDSGLTAIPVLTNAGMAIAWNE